MHGFDMRAGLRSELLNQGSVGCETSLLVSTTPALARDDMVGGMIPRQNQVSG